MAEALGELLRPVRQRRVELDEDPAYVESVLAEGAATAHAVAARTYAAAADAMGLLAPGGSPPPEPCPPGQAKRMSTPSTPSHQL